jgi:hypothetical protein
MCRAGGLGEHALHAIDGPEQIDRRRPRDRHQLAGFVKLGGQLLRAGGLAHAHAQREPHRGGDANGRSSANDHGLDGLGHFFGRLAFHVDFSAR